MDNTAKWNIGDRVTREVYLDDGTWTKRGDSCLKDSPLLHGEVVAASSRFVRVKWDNTNEEKVYLNHGVDREIK